MQKIGIIFLVVLAWSSTTTMAAKLPNVLIIYYDDTGWTDFASFGGNARTPHIDALASQGAKFTDYYAPAPNCSPSRAGLLTGRFPYRSGVYGHLSSRTVMHLRDSEITLAEALKDVGYATGMFGKWHLSALNGKQPGPGEQGFDYWFASRNNLIKENPKSLIRNGKPVKETNGWASQVVADEAISWMKNQEKPFFAYVAFSETHTPNDSPKELQKYYRSQGESPKSAVYKGMVEYSDASVGSLMQALDEMGIAENTIVFLASDNGPMDGKSCQGLRGKKSHVWEGGLRVPGIMRWPNTIKPGTIIDSPVGAVDLFPTLSAITGFQLPQDRVIDGVNILPLLQGKAFKREKPLMAFFYRMDPAASLRSEQWTLIGYSEDGQRKKSHAIDIEADMPKIKESNLIEFKLYNVKEDLAQSKDVSSEYPEVFERLKKQMIAIHQEAIAEGPYWQNKKK